MVSSSRFHDLTPTSESWGERHTCSRGQLNVLPTSFFPDPVFSALGLSVFTLARLTSLRCRYGFYSLTCFTVVLSAVKFCVHITIPSHAQTHHCLLLSGSQLIIQDSPDVVTAVVSNSNRHRWHLSSKHHSYHGRLFAMLPYFILFPGPFLRPFLTTFSKSTIVNASFQVAGAFASLDAWTAPIAMSISSARLYSCGCSSCQRVLTRERYKSGS